MFCNVGFNENKKKNCEKNCMIVLVYVKLIYLDYIVKMRSFMIKELDFVLRIGGIDDVV